MTTMSDLPEDLTKEIFSMVPLTSLNAVRSTCKNWNSISKSEVLCESAARRKHFLGFMMKDFRVCSMKFDLQGIQNEADFVDPSIKQVSVLDQVEISQIFQCEGLLLCVTRDQSRLLVWNPYLGQTRWIQPRNTFLGGEKYAIGYDKNHNHKILGILGDYKSGYMVLGYEIFDLSSNTWKVSNVNHNWHIDYYQRGVSLKGHTYFLVEEKIRIGETNNNTDCILSFDFTTERFRKLLPMPFKSHYSDKVVLSCVREEQLAVILHYSRVIGQALEIWVTIKIDHGEVSWRKFLRVTSSCIRDIKPGSFFVDEEKKVVLVVDLLYKRWIVTGLNQSAHILGPDRYFKSVNIGKTRYIGKRSKHGYMINELCRTHACSSYVPSSVQLQTKPTGKIRRK
ncbi:F-box/kelch-repeat protein [Raphanus sativus]|uniref:F-box/kelch-repeat protein At3g13680-like n=1 Tax=Raphanus sativus TaxID=3726 RepID=A0A6J0JIB9_RAPSA|nr:F-box/kelch-repeat protein At3g13680-like [Raphanus sativus]KAJ4867727.1 F-box/kelch-repeat protein [Raphanus sativus]KAJ4885731.1 F-box/kelch-repeat protein [Raphanus sativus]